MKLRNRLTGTACFAAIIGGMWLSPSSAQEVPKMMMTTEIPEGITTPDNIQTRVGELNFFDGVPDVESAQKVYNLLDFTHAYQAFLDGTKIASMDAIRKGILEFGPANTTAVLFEGLMDAKALFLTANTTSVYMFSWLQLGDEPMVIETPPNVLGFINDHWFKYVIDFGNLGPDEGQGGKFLVLPPGYEGEVPDGYHVARTNTNGNWVIWRGYQKDGTTDLAISQTKELFRMYPLSQKDNPPEMNFVNASGQEMNTIHRMDAEIFSEINDVVQSEPLMGENPELLGHLAAIGIVKGQPFEPDERMQAILEAAAKAGSVTVKTIISKPNDERFYWYPGESYWQTAFPGGAYTWELDGVTVQDIRAAFHFYATGVTPAMALKAVGKGSQYAFTYVDSNGTPLDGAKTYKVNVPADVPAEDFWSFTLYDNQTRSMLQTDAQFPAIGSNDSDVVQNEDGSYDIYFAPEAPEGKDSNWVQTVPGKGWNTIFRLYGPLEPWFDQTWRPGDIELVDFASSVDSANAETAEDITLRITVDGRVAVYGVQFDTGSTSILPGSEGTLSAIAEMMKELPDLKVAVVGHTDNVGGYDTNLDLSKRRADAVVADLINTYGIDSLRLFAAGASFLAPIASNETDDGRALNRRVELVRAP
ncbi:DUF1214 domain-containing protein [Pelagimonas varians]|uniref:Putative lipoprotein YiaD n=1 Tax=Pelagimonas varians TaxID=696760 RepID=A0A238JUE0_9RHOB|nr:DUF1214 domain-containing protein [Pelagimonas varians]PYG34370.1 hypothetical protein C8N36_10120 [Pelagimonas varians]SMX34271.1 putative lipoprotein YiaD precursor [Pelagimonas varians]